MTIHLLIKNNIFSQSLPVLSTRTYTQVKKKMTTTRKEKHLNEKKKIRTKTRN